MTHPTTATRCPACGGRVFRETRYVGGRGYVWFLMCEKQILANAWDDAHPTTWEDKEPIREEEAP